MDLGETPTMANNWRTDLPEPKSYVILCFEFPNSKYNKVTVGYYSPKDKEYGADCYRDMLDNSNAFDDTFEPRSVSIEHVIGWMPFPAHMRNQ